jgi:hypothetical protein
MEIILSLPKKMQKITFLLILLYSFNAFSQKSSDTTYTYIDEEIIGGDNPVINKKKINFFIGSSYDYATYRYSGIYEKDVDSKIQQQNLENAKNESKLRIATIKNQYIEAAVYPKKITDGWHSVVMTDNINFCKDAKVLISKNRITKVVVDDYLPLDFQVTGEVINAKNLITIKNYNNQELNIIDVYFIFDMLEPTLTNAPKSPGYICFWSDLKNYGDIIIKIENVETEKLGIRFETQPECFQEGTVYRIMKPGVYKFIAQGKGTIDWEGSFVIKGNMCLRYRLGK